MSPRRPPPSLLERVHRAARLVTPPASHGRRPSLPPPCPCLVCLVDVHDDRELAIVTAFASGALSGIVLGPRQMAAVLCDVHRPLVLGAVSAGLESVER